MARTPPHLATLVVLTALTVLSLNMFLPALPAMRQSFGVSEAVMGLSISAYMACAAVFQLALGTLSDRIGRRPVVLGALVIYVVTSLVCLFAQNIGVFLAARAVQAVAVAGGILSSAMVRDLYDGRDAAAKLATIATAMAVAPMLAPVLGGLVDAWLGWRAVFATYALLGLGVLILVHVDLGETRKVAKRMSLLQGIAALLGERVFWAYTVVAGFSIGTFFIFLTGAPFVASQVFGLNSAQIGIILGTTPAGFFVGAGLSSRLVNRTGPTVLMVAGRVAPFLGLAAALGVFWVGAGSLWVLVAAALSVGFGNGLTVANANAGALSVRPDMAGTAAGVLGASVLILGALLSGFATTVLSVEASPALLIALMLGAVTVSLTAALLARVWDRGWGRA